MTTPTISRQHIDGATWKKGRRDYKVPAGSMTERQSFAGRCTIMALEPDNLVADVRHGLVPAGVFHGVNTCLLDYGHVAQDLAGLAFQLNHPAGRSGRLIERLHSCP